MAEGGIGESLPRIEDLDLVQGLGRYTDDLAQDMPGTLHLYVVRSPFAAARITSINVEAARQANGVVAVLTPADMAEERFHAFPIRVMRERSPGEPSLSPPYFPLAKGQVRHVGEPVVAVVARSSGEAKDAGELVEIDYDELPAVMDIATAADVASPKVWEDFPDNVCFELRAGDQGRVDDLFAQAKHVVSERIVISRMTASPLEPRTALGQYDRRTRRYTLYAGLQSPHAIRQEIAQVFGLPLHRFRVVAPDVGGAFGMKASLHPELILVLWASRLTGHPVKHVSERSEGFMSDHQSRDTVSEVSLALDDNGMFLALRVETIANIGAYVASNGLHSPTNNIGGLAGVYTTQAHDVTVRGVFTNSLPTCPFRGAGRPEASYLIETIIDRAARQIDIDRTELRRRNMIPASAMPYQTSLVYAYDCGEFEAVMDQCLACADWHGFEGRRRDAAARGKLKGIGIACVIELAGGPYDRPFEEGVELRFDPTGDLTILAGGHSQGQGHVTAYKQIAAEFLGMPPDRVNVVFGDTDAVPHGRGTFGSRTMMAFAGAFCRSCEKIVTRATGVAAHLLEVAPADVEFTNGVFLVSGTDRSVSLPEVAAASFRPKNLPRDMDIGLQEAAIVALPNGTFPNACHICEVEIDPYTGERDITAYNVVDDVGTVISPLMLKGQIHGGIAQGVGQLLDECVVYDESGQLITGSFQDYGLPRAFDLPEIHVHSHPVPTNTNPLGVKGAGEAGTVGALPAVMSAIRDALAQAGVKALDMPATPFAIWSALNSAGQARDRNET